MIQFVYFDIGGVVIRDFSKTKKWAELRHELGVTPLNEDVFNKIWNIPGGTRDTTFDVDNLVPLLKRELNADLPEHYSLLMGFVNRFEKNEAIWPVISMIKKDVRVGLLTNQYPRMFERICAKGIMPLIDWDVVIDSSVVKMKKPDREIFKLAEERAGAQGDSILFVDNSQVHLDAAEKDFGWKTFLFDPVDSEKSSQELLEYFNRNR